MDADKSLMSALDALARELDSGLLEPDPTREDWMDQGDALDAVRRLRRELTQMGERRAVKANAAALAILHDERAADQEVTAALADAKRASGDVDAALALLSSYGGPGHLNARAQRTLAGCYADQDAAGRSPRTEEHARLDAALAGSAGR